MSENFRYPIALLFFLITHFSLWYYSCITCLYACFSLQLAGYSTVFLDVVIDTIMTSATCSALCRTWQVNFPLWKNWGFYYYLTLSAYFMSIYIPLEWWGVVSSFSILPFACLFGLTFCYTVSIPSSTKLPYSGRCPNTKGIYYNICGVEVLPFSLSWL